MEVLCCSGYRERGTYLHMWWLCAGIRWFYKEILKELYLKTTCRLTTGPLTCLLNAPVKHLHCK